MDSQIQMPLPGMTYTSSLVVTDAHTALAMGSGDLPVFATPAMVALMENAAMNAVAVSLPEGMTTVGGLIEAQHLAPSLVGASVEAKATLTEVKGRKFTFDIEAFEGDKVIGKAKHIRFAVQREGFVQ